MPLFQSLILALVVRLLLPAHHARNTWNDPAEQVNRLLRLR